MAKAPGTGMDKNSDLIFKKAVGLSLFRIIDLIDHLDFDKVIP
jgi:hypothetical protein